LLAVRLAGNFAENPQPAITKKSPRKQTPAKTSHELNTPTSLTEKRGTKKKWRKRPGGRAYFPSPLAQRMQFRVTEIAQLVRHEYSLAFAPPFSRRSPFTSIEVRVVAGRICGKRFWLTLTASISTSVPCNLGNRRLGISPKSRLPPTLNCQTSHYKRCCQSAGKVRNSVRLRAFGGLLRMLVLHVARRTTPISESDHVESNAHCATAGM